LDVEQQPVVEPVRDKLDAADVVAVDVAQPQHGAGDLCIEPSGDQDDPDSPFQDGVFSAGVFEEVRQLCSGIGGRDGVVLSQVAFVGLGELLKRPNAAPKMRPTTKTPDKQRIR
jgi:hypothetical protein